MTRRKRILLELFGPPLLGGAFIQAIWTSSAWWHTAVKGMTWEGNAGILVWMVVVLVYAYLFAGIPSILYTAIMEWRFSRGLDPRSWRAVSFSACLGLISGVAIFLAFVGGSWDRPAPGFLYGGVGCIVGFVLGWMIKVFSATGQTAPERI